MSLTKKQQQVLRAIQDYARKQSIMPSVREIMDILGLSSPATVHQHIDVLVREGFLKKTNEATRNLILVREERQDVQSVMLPLVGLIAAGEPIEAIEERGETVAVPADLAGMEDNYVLRVRGRSMIDEGILDGDYVIVERNFYPQNGDVVVALLDNQYATLKKFFREKNRIRLQPANSTMEPIFVKNPAIQGIVRAIIRKFSNN